MFIVYAWNNRSEAGYYFGPFKAESVAEFWADKKLTSQYVNASSYCLNAPSLMGTGQELS